MRDEVLQPQVTEEELKIEYIDSALYIGIWQTDWYIFQELYDKLGTGSFKAHPSHAEREKEFSNTTDSTRSRSRAWSWSVSFIVDAKLARNRFWLDKQNRGEGWFHLHHEYMRWKYIFWKLSLLGIKTFSWPSMADSLKINLGHCNGSS